MAVPSRKRMPVKVRGPTPAMPSACATKAEPQMTATASNTRLACERFKMTCPGLNATVYNPRVVELNGSPPAPRISSKRSMQGAHSGASSMVSLARA